MTAFFVLIALTSLALVSALYPLGYGNGFVNGANERRTSPSGSTPVHVTQNYGCKFGKDGYFADPLKPYGYIRCERGQETFHECWHGLIFNAKTERCEKNSVGDSSEAAPRRLPGVSPSGPTPAYRSYACPREYGYFPDPASPTRYIFCQNYQKFFFECGAGLVFDPAYAPSYGCVHASA